MYQTTSPTLWVLFATYNISDITRTLTRYLRLGQCPMMHRQRHASGQEAGELVHLGLELIPAGEELSDEEEVVGHGPLA